jgi:methylenetetrahydrofolate reductase (NADPH)
VCFDEKATVSGWRATLAKFAIRCGVGHSLRALTSGHASVTRLLVEADPARIIASLTAADRGAIGLAGLHFFTFGGVRLTSAWIDAVKRGEFDLLENGGFRVRR